MLPDGVPRHLRESKKGLAGLRTGVSERRSVDGIIFSNAGQEGFCVKREKREKEE